MITDEEKAWCALAETRGVGPRTLWAIADYLESERRTAAWLLEHPESMEIVLNGRATVSDVSLASELVSSRIEDLEKNSINVLHPTHPQFPERLREFRERFPVPAVLYATGNISLLNRPGVAVVGARQGGDLAIEVTRQLVAQVVAEGINVISGYAKGIDTAAHLTALQESGTTTIVLSEGINGFRHRRELKSLFTGDNMLAVSQFEPDAQWVPGFAMIRNRLVCALSGAVFVAVSGPERDSDGRMSGTFNAALTAVEMDIPAFVVSPDFFDDQPEGNRALIERGCREWFPSDGAIPILDAMRPTPSASDDRPAPGPGGPKTKQLEFFESKE
jgi:DNA processing protein